MIKDNYGEEQWKDIPDYEGYYMVSDRGRIKSVDRYINSPNGKEVLRHGRLMKLYTTDLGYKRVHLSKNNIQKNYPVHRLVAEAFVPHLRSGNVVNHKDENPSNNCYINLEWGDYAYNNQYNGLNKKRFETRSINIRKGLVELGYKIICLDNNYNFVKEYVNAEWVRQDGYDSSVIRSAAKRKKVKSAKKHYWIYKDEYEDLLSIIPQSQWFSFMKIYIVTGNVYQPNHEMRIQSIMEWFKQFCNENK